MMPASPSSLRRRILAADADISAILRRAVAGHPRMAHFYTIIAHAGDGLACYLAIAAVALVAPATRPTVWRAFLATLLAAAIVALNKMMFRRPRPLPEASNHWSLLGQHDAHAFPSGHAARTSAIAAATWGTSPLVGMLTAIWSLAVSTCRVGLGAHYVGDVLAGTLVGVISALLLNRLG